MVNYIQYLKLTNQELDGMKLNILKRKTPVERELEALEKRERRFMEQRRAQKEGTLNRLLADKVPDKLQNTLDTAFNKAFALMFEKGVGLIEKTYNREALRREYDVSIYADSLHSTRKTLRKFSKKAGKTGAKNLTLSGVSGVGLGILGIGLPDIPVFTGMILKCIYETALNYGFEYSSESEKYFVLLLIEGAVSYGGNLEEVDGKIEKFIAKGMPSEGYSLYGQMAKTSGALSKELLYMKFLQGIPIVGVVGGAYDAVYMRRISQYARLKYQKRFLLGRRHSNKQAIRNQ